MYDSEQFSLRISVIVEYTHFCVMKKQECKTTTQVFAHQGAEKLRVTEKATSNTG